MASLSRTSLLTRPLRDAPADIYSQYVSYCNDINAKIHAIDSLDPVKRQQPNVQNDRDFLVSSIGMLTPIYQKDYKISTLDGFIADCAGVIQQVAQAFADAMGPSNPYASKIQADLTSAQGITGGCGLDIKQAGTVLNAYSTLQSSISALQSQIDLLLPGPDKDKAEADLNIAIINLSVFQAACTKAQAGFSSLNDTYDSLTQTGGSLDQLKNLASIMNPNEGNQDTADGLLTLFTALKQQDDSFQSGPMKDVNALFSLIPSSIQKTQNDLKPTPSAGSVQNGCWYIDWTSWDFGIPEGVDTVNIFVGQLDNSTGTCTVSGFGNMNDAKMKAFIQSCTEQGIKVKVSLGGGGGSYDNCWDKLTSANVGDFATGLVDFCHKYGLSGIDFDYEENGTQAQKVLVGTLIKQMKALDSSLETSLCTNASFQGWKDGVQTIMDASVSNGKASLDRLYVMSYYDPIASEEGWLASWNAWLQDRYGFKSSQLTVGIDDFDAHAYDVSQMASYAASQGMSTCYWAFDPSNMAKSNASTVKILQSYNASYVQSLKDKPFKTATRVQKLFAALKWGFHGLFVRWPSRLVQVIQNLFKKPSNEFFQKGRFDYVPMPSAPPEDPS
jgi:Glycosyl hydrolases family 18